MKFVTKEEFEKALATLEAATASGQIRYGRYDEEGDEMTSILFGDARTDVHRIVVPSNAVHFVSASVAAKAKLISVRKALSKQQEESNKNQKTIENLESEERKLANLVPTLKE
jgi:hypothetical protein